MVADDGGDRRVNRSARVRAAVAQHGRVVVEIAVATAVGILATAALQIAATRGLGPDGFGLFAAFLAIINVAAIGSSALRSAVAVSTADPAGAASSVPVSARRRRLDGFAVEALVLGGVSTVAMLAAIPLLSNALDAPPVALVFAIATIAPYFLFARAQGLLQGAGDARSVIWWTSATQVAQLILGIVAMALGFGVLGILAAYLACVAAATVGASVQARRISLDPRIKPFTSNSIVVILLTLAFAWLTNADVVLVRAYASEVMSGSYAAAAVLIKSTLILPATLSLFLLPRFVRQRHDRSGLRAGVNFTLVVTAIAGIAMFVLVILVGRPLIELLFGDAYELAIELLPGFALMWIPWAMSQAMLARITAAASRIGLLLLLLASVAQWGVSALTLPDVGAMMFANGITGTCVLVTMFIIHLRTGPGRTTDQVVE
jgi:O-antigen/teichoic acid export membrane protein